VLHLKSITLLRVQAITAVNQQIITKLDCPAGKYQGIAGRGEIKNRIFNKIFLRIIFYSILIFIILEKYESQCHIIKN